MKKSVKAMSLSRKISRFISAVLIVIFALLIMVSLKYTRDAVLEATYSELFSTSKANGLQIQESMNICESTAYSLISQMDEAFTEKSTVTPATEPVGLTSVVYPDLKLTEIEKDLEDFMISTAKNAVKHNSNIIGIGIMFEPYKYTPNRESYALYFTDSDNKVGVSDVGNYSEFSQNEYYQIALDKSGTVFTKPYVYREMWMITGATPIITNGKVIGVVNIDIDMGKFSDMDLKNESYPSLSVRIVGEGGMIAFDSLNAEYIGKQTQEIHFKDLQDAENTLSSMSQGHPTNYKYRQKDGTNVYSFSYPIKAGIETWGAITTVDINDIEEASVKTGFGMATYCIIFLLVIILVIYKALKTNLDPVTDIVQAAEQIANGNLNISINLNREDEIGVLAKTFLWTSQSLKQMITDIETVLGEIANNNLNVSTNVEYKGDFQKIQGSMEHIILNINSVMKDINISSHQVSMGSEQISNSSQILSHGTEEQAESIDNLSLSITQISENIGKNAENAQKAQIQSSSSKEEIEGCNRKMQEMIEAMSEIRIKSSEIGRIIKAVQDIAFQTNILALNAAVEASRAGAAGKGFAVVADEVRRLAGKSADAVKETTALIEDTVMAVENGAKIADNTAATMEIIVENNKKVTEFVCEIAEASSIQSDEITRIVGGIKEISSVVEINSATAEEGADSSKELSSQAQVLRGLVERFRLKD